jgi:hypothetical protein
VADGNGIRIAHVSTGTPTADNADVKVLNVHGESEETTGEHAQRAVDYLSAHGLEAESQRQMADKMIDPVRR